MYLGQVLDEAYANGGAANIVQLLASATKGFTGLIGAMAAADGLFALDEPVAQRALTEWQSDAQKSKITYRHLLSMTSGLEELKEVAAWIDYLNAPVNYPSGSTFIYSGDPNIFGLALERRLGGESVVSYFSRRLLQPLGITSLQWASNFLDGHPQLSGGAYTTARDWTLLGEFVRRTMDGTWTGAALLPRSLFDTVFAGNPAHPAYGFLLVAQGVGAGEPGGDHRRQQQVAVRAANQADHRQPAGTRRLRDGRLRLRATALRDSFAWPDGRAQLAQRQRSVHRHPFPGPAARLRASEQPSRRQRRQVLARKTMPYRTFS